jgi:acyl-coenzyme A thioesterase PaaI-like protein
MRALPHTHSCFVCGDSNAAGLKLRFETDGRIVQARFAPCPQHVGFRDTIHGGLIATVLDEIMVWACAVATRKFAWAAELNVRFLAPLHPGEAAVATGELAANRRDRIYEAKGELRNAAGETIATATGKYLPIRDADIKTMLADLVGDTSAFLAPVE